MTQPSSDEARPAQIKVYDAATVIQVEITGPTEAAVLHAAGNWMATYDAALIVAFTWRGDVADEDDRRLYQLDMAVDMDLAISEGQWAKKLGL
jgi:hypothetical protein